MAGPGFKLGPLALEPYSLPTGLRGPAQYNVFCSETRKVIPNHPQKHKNAPLICGTDFENLLFGEKWFLKSQAV